MDGVEFLSRFNHSLYTLAYIHKNTVRSFACKPENIKEALTFLGNQNNAGSEIYFTPNEGNGTYNKSKTACHSTKNIINLSALFLDAELIDGSDPLPAVLNFCATSFKPPSLIVSTSTNRYHVYWLLASTPVTKDTVVKWKKLQNYLHLTLSSDRTMTDLPQLLRIPTFQNIKKSHLVTCIQHTDYMYTLDDCYSLLADSIPEFKAASLHDPLPIITPDYKLLPGTRHEELLRRARKGYAQGLQDEEVKCLIHGFIDLHLDNPKEFLNGHRAHEVSRILQAAKNYDNEERLKATSAAIIKHVDSKTSPFELPPEFFYQAPGLVGDLTRYLTDSSPYPIPALSFAAAASIVGLLKSRYIRSPENLPPSNYFLCFAPVGSGKSIIQSNAKRLLKELHVLKHFQRGIGSAQGIIEFLGDNLGQGLLFLDEVKPLFAVTGAHSKNVASYERNIGPELTELYSAHSSFYVSAYLKTSKPKFIDQPCLSLTAFGQVELVNEFLSIDSVKDGLLTRFIAIHVSRYPKETAIKATKIPVNLLSALRHLATKSGIALEANAAQHGIAVATPITRLVYSSESALLLELFKRTIEGYRDSALEAGNGLSGLFARSVEQAIRLSTCMSAGDEIDALVMQFCVDLVSNQAKQFYEQFGSALDPNKEHVILNDLIVNLCAKSKDYTTTKRAIQRAALKRLRNDHFRQAYQALVETGTIIENQTRLPSGQASIQVTVGEAINQ